MKLKAELIDRAAKWVEENGLYPQRCGAPIKRFLEYFGIDYRTFKRWQEKAAFAEAIKKANGVFAENTVEEVVNALKKKALGYTVTTSDAEYKAQVVREYDPKTGKKVKEYTTDKGVKVRETRKDVHVAPDTGAAIFLLTNLDSENWKNRRDNKSDVELNIENEEPPVIVFKTQEATEASEAEEANAD